MAPTKTATKTAQKRATRTSAKDAAFKGFSAEEKAAARERVRELKAEAARIAANAAVELDRTLNSFVAFFKRSGP